MGLGNKLLEVLKRKFVTFLLTLLPIKPRPLKAQRYKKLMSFLMVKLLPTVIWMLEKISIKTSFFLAELPFMKVSQIELRKNSIHFAQNPELLKSLPLPIDTTQYGPVVPLFHLSPPSKLNGLPKRSTKKMVPRL